MIAVAGDRVELQMAIAAIDSAIVLAWCAAGWRSLVPSLRLPPLRWLLVPLPIAVVTFGVAHDALTGLSRAFGIEVLWITPDFLEAGYGVGTIVLCVCVQPALIEELAFRGVILDALRETLSVGEAMLVSTLLFAILHLSIPALPHLALLGLVMAGLRVRTGSLLPGMVLHFAHNGLCVLMELRS